MKIQNKFPISMPALIGFSLLFIGIAQIAALLALQTLNDKYPLGREGLVLEYPLTRQKFARDFLFPLHSYF